MLTNSAYYAREDSKLTLKLPKIGTPYSEASRLWQAMRWLIPIGIAIMALLMFLFPPETFRSGFTAQSFPSEPSKMFVFHRSFQLEYINAEIFFFVSMIPTIFLYRFIIAIGERCWVKKPIYGALVAVVALAIIPPSVDQLLIRRSLNNLDFVSSVPDLRGKSVLLYQDGRGGPECAQYCLRLLYGSKVKRVISMQRFPENPSMETKAAVGYRLSKPKNCTYNLIKSTTSRADAQTTVKRAAGQIASGNCIAEEIANYDQVDFILKVGIDVPYNRYITSQNLLPKSLNTYGIHHAELAMIEKITDTKREKLLQVVNSPSVSIMHYPTAPIIGGPTWFWSTMFFDEREQTDPTLDKFKSLGLNLGEPKDIGFSQTEKLVTDAIDKKDMPLHKSHRTLRRSYLSHIAKGKLSTNRIDIISRMISDPRVQTDDLYLLARVFPKAGNEKLIDELMAQLRSYRAAGREQKDYRQHIIGYSRLIMTGSDQATWSHILPDVRKITSDTTMLAYSSELMPAYGAGNSADAERLLKTFSQLVAENGEGSLRSNSFQLEDGEYRARRRARANEFGAVMIGLCALADKSDNILPTITASALDNVPGRGRGMQSQIWRALVKFGVDIEQMAGELQIHSEQRKQIRLIAKDASRECGTSIDG